MFYLFVFTQPERKAADALLLDVLWNGDSNARI